MIKKIYLSSIEKKYLDTQHYENYDKIKKFTNDLFNINKYGIDPIRDHLFDEYKKKMLT